MQRKFLCLLFLLVILTLSSLEAKAADLLPGMDDARSYFCETFTDKTIKNNEVLDTTGKVIWQINEVEEQTNAITDTGALELGGAQYMQRAVLADDLWRNKQNYAMEFTMNVQKIGNEGRSERPIAVIIPRSKDKNFKSYYAVTYSIENTIANQFKFKWAIINTAAPTKMKPLVEGYYLLRENVDYTARLVIQNTFEGYVNIKFYIDGPINPVDEFKPLLNYMDNSPYKISSGVTGPAFGMVGYLDDGWGTSPVVRFDNIKLYGTYEFKQYEEQLKEYALINPNDIKTNESFGEIKYLINKGIIGSYPDNNFRPNEFVTVAQFLKILLNLRGEKYPEGETHWADYYIKRGIELGIIEKNEFSDYDKPLTKYEVAFMITRFKGNPPGDKKYVSCIKDNRLIPDKYLNAVLYTYSEGYLRLNDSCRFRGSHLITRAKAAQILLRMLDAGFRKNNYALELPNVLSSGAVLQRNKKIPIWGRGFSGENITVKFKNQVKSTVVEENGHWYLELDPEPAGGPYTLTVTSTKRTMKLEDILIGEVFVVAGQSNAEMFLYECNGAEETKEKLVGKKNLRFYSGEQITAVRPNFTSIGKWEASNEWVVEESSAIGTFFVEKLLELNKDLTDVPIGIIRVTYGGTSIEAFMPNCITVEKNYVPQDNKPIMSGFWNGFMEPITPYSIKAAMYYQGENSTQLGYGYESLLRDYLRGLRTEFKDDKLPIMLVQLAGFGYNDYESDRNEWPIIRDVQRKVANSTNNTGLVTAVDLADPDPIEIHPKEKKEIGKRLAYLGMNLIYGKKLEKRSAELKDYHLNGNKVILSFAYDYGRLYFKDNIAKDFQVFDNKGKWHMSNAIINKENNTLEIWHDKIQEPMGVRYAWVNNPNISLYNNVDFPALPFRVVFTPAITGEKILKVSNHLLKTNDAIVNTKTNIFRVVEILDQNTISHVYPIKGQSAEDTIEKFTKFSNLIAQEGTTETIIKISGHGLSVGDWIRNNTRGWEPRRVDAVIDTDTIQVGAVSEQSAGDDIGTYKFIGKAIAE